MEFVFAGTSGQDLGVSLPEGLGTVADLHGWQEGFYWKRMWQMNSTRHFIIVEVETKDEQSSKDAEDRVFNWLKANSVVWDDSFTFRSVGWIADHVREAPTGVKKL